MKKIVLIVLLTLCVFSSVSTLDAAATGLTEEFNYTRDDITIGSTSNYNVYAHTSVEGHSISITEDGYLNIATSALANASTPQKVQIRDNGGAANLFDQSGSSMIVETSFKMDNTYRKNIQLYFNTGQMVSGTTTITLLSFTNYAAYYNLNEVTTYLPKVNEDGYFPFISDETYTLKVIFLENGDLQDEVFCYVNDTLLYTYELPTGFDFKGQLCELSYSYSKTGGNPDSSWLIDYAKISEYTPRADVEVKDLKNSLKLSYSTTDLGYEITNTSLRFGVSLTEEEYEGYSDLTKFGIIAGLTSKLGSSTIEELFIASKATTIEEFKNYLDDQEITVNNLELSKSELVVANASGTAWEVGEKYYQYSMVIENIPTENYETSFTAIAYYIIDGKIYFGNQRTNSVSLVASQYKEIDSVMSDPILSELINLITK